MPKEKQQPQPPVWARELSEKYQSGISYTFLVHGNIHDYVGGIAGQTLRNYLLASFSSREIVVYWNMKSGFVIPDAAMRHRFAEIVGLPLQQAAPQPPGRASGFASGLNTVSQQGTDLVETLAKVKNPSAALELLTRLLEYKPKKRAGEEEKPFPVSVILDYSEYIVPETNGIPSEQERLAIVTLMEWARDPLIASHDAIIVMIASDATQVNERLRQSGARWEQIEIPYPDFAERAAFMRQLVEAAGDVAMEEGFSYEDFARLTTGLRLIDLEDILLRASFLHEPISQRLVKSRKDEIMRSEYAELLQVEEADFGFESIGGMAEIKAFVRDTIITSMRSGHLRLVPQGMLLIGPPGTGKTRFSRALSKEAGVTFVVLQLEKIFIKWVGDTERRLAHALYAIKQMAPAIVFIDEIDQAFQRGESGDSGVSNRVFKHLMEFMSDTSLRGRVLFIAATNRPDLMDAALLRPGRFDVKIPFFSPNAAERAAILTILTQAAFPDTELPDEEVFRELALQMEGYSGAELENVVGKAANVFARGTKTIAEALQYAYETIIPGASQSVDAMTRLALLYCNDLELVPVEYRELARQLRHPQAQQALHEELEEAQPAYTRRKREL